MSDARAKRLTLIASVLGSAVVFFDGTIVNFALPALRADLGAPYRRPSRRPVVM